MEEDAWRGKGEGEGSEYEDQEEEEEEGVSLLFKPWGEQTGTTNQSWEYLCFACVKYLY